MSFPVIKFWLEEGIHEDCIRCGELTRAKILLDPVTDSNDFKLRPICSGCFSRHFDCTKAKSARMIECGDGLEGKFWELYET